ncbi:MAG: glycosyltransferase [Oscillospiraceae bacterium]
MNNDYAVLMSVYEKETPAHFSHSLDSILAQTVQCRQFVLVCDGALGDALEAVIARYERRFGGRMDVVRLETHSRLGNALNAGLARCRYEIVLRMDADDVAKPYRAEKQLAAMANGAGLCSAFVAEFSGTPTRVTAIKTLPVTHEQIVRYMRRRNPMNHPCTTFLKSAVERAGGYQDCPWFEDYDLWVRMLRSGCRAVNVPEVLLFMRAGKEMYARRGGFAYLKHALRFRLKLLRAGASTLPDFLASAAAQTASALMPVSLRKRLYELFLRKYGARTKRA